MINYRQLPYHPKHRCEAEISDQNKKWRLMHAQTHNKPPDYRCHAQAICLLDEQFFCKRHAEMSALAYIKRESGS